MLNKNERSILGEVGTCEQEWGSGDVLLGCRERPKAYNMNIRLRSWAEVQPLTVVL